MWSTEGHPSVGAVILVTVLGLVVALLLAVALLYNRLVRLRVRCDQAWAQVDAQLQRRHDLVPNLVAVVGGYAGHERDALDQVASTRAAALRVADPEARAAAEDLLGAALARLLILSEEYPALRADGRFRHLQDELTGTEQRIAFARGFANDRVARYRAAISTFPGVIVARVFDFEDRPMFDADDGAATVPHVSSED